MPKRARRSRRTTRKKTSNSESVELRALARTMKRLDGFAAKRRKKEAKEHAMLDKLEKAMARASSTRRANAKSAPKRRTKKKARKKSTKRRTRRR